MTYRTRYLVLPEHPGYSVRDMSDGRTVGVFSNLKDAAAKARELNAAEGRD